MGLAFGFLLDGGFFFNVDLLGLMWTRGMRNGVCVCGGEEAPWGVGVRLDLCPSGCRSAFCKVEQQRKESTSPAPPP